MPMPLRQYYFLLPLALLSASGWGVGLEDMKLAPEFLRLKRQLLDRIRDTSGMKTDLDLLAQLSRSAADVASGAGAHVGAANDPTS